jgi:outer membrane receptor for Fe3+-dicitrate
MGIPIQPAPYCDPYLTQISKSIRIYIVVETTKSQRYSTRRRNCFQNYTKVGE